MVESAPPNGAPVNFVERALRTALYATALLFAAHQALTPMAETDLFFHLKLGDLIRQTHAIPFRNLFSFTNPDHPDPDLAWGYQVAVSLLYQLAGFPAIVVFKALCTVAAAALTLAASRRAGATPLAAATATVLAVEAMGQRLVERPHTMTFVGIGALSYLLVTAEARPRRWWLAPLLVLIWSNFHAGVFLASVMLICWLIGAGLDRAPLPSRAQLAAVLALCITATFATPAGKLLPRYLLWHTGLGATRIIEEFRVADPWDDPWFFTMMTVCAVGVIALGRRTRLRFLLAPIAVAFLAWRSVRFVAEWALIATPLAALGLTAIGQVFAARTKQVATALATVALLVTIVRERREQGFYLDLDAEVAPFDAIDYVTKNGLRERMFHDLDVGCYLLWEGWPRYRVFEDARLPAYPDSWHRALDNTPLEPRHFDPLLQKYGVDTALINYPDINMRAGSFDPTDWALVYRDSQALVFVRRLPKYAAVIARDELPFRVRFSFSHGTSFESLR